MVAVPQPGDEIDSTSPFSPSPFDGAHASMNAAGSSSLLPLYAVQAPASHGPAASPSPGSIDTSEKIDVGEGDASTDSFSPTSAGPTPSKLFPTSPFYSHQDAVRAPAAVSCRQHCPSCRGARKQLHLRAVLPATSFLIVDACLLAACSRELTTRDQMLLGRRSRGWAR